ncbi:uncharacterized protein LOC144563653 [Carex rostrata]
MSTGNENARLENLQRERDQMAHELQLLRAAAVDRQNNEVADANRPLRDFTAPRAEKIHLGYTAPTINAEEYQIPPAWVSMVQRNLFHDLPHEDATQHLANFEEICTTIKVQTVSPEDIKVMAFTFSLADKAKGWIRGQRPENMNTWPKVANAFLNKFFPPSKTNSLRHQIHNFRQKGDETMSEAWERFQELQRCCPHHGIEGWNLLQIFYNSLMPHDKGMLDAAAGGSLMNKGAVDGYKLVDDMALNQSQWHNPRETPIIMQRGMKEVNSNQTLAAEIAALNRKIDQLSVNSVNNSSPLSCSICGGTDHLAINCGVSNDVSYEEVNAINQGNFKPNNNPYSNTYNPGWRNHPNFSWRQNDQLTQVAQQASSSFRQQGILPSKPDINPREYTNAITLRSGTEYQGRKMLETQPPSARLNANTPASDLSQEPGNSNPAKVKSIETPKYIIPPLRFVPFPQRLVNNKLDQQFIEFVDKKKCTIEENKHVILDEKCSAIFSTDLPLKMKDPDSFSIPCSIDTTRIENAMCDLIASVSLIPKSVYDKLESGNLEPTNMSLTLADGTTQSLLGILKNVVVKIGKIKIPVDFVVIETDDHSAVLLGRAFLATAGANIKVKEGELSFSVGKKKETFYFHKPLIPPNKNSVCMIEISQVNREFMQKESVETSETDKSRENRHKTEQWGGRPPDPPPKH